MRSFARKPRMPRRRVSGLVLAAAMVSLLCGCATNSYMGVQLAPGAAEPALQTLAKRARSGDKEAQLALGIRFEEGIDVSRDLMAARRLYRSAAMPTKHLAFIYVPPAGAGGSGAVVPISIGRAESGLPTAAERLAALKRRKQPN